jgi:hypothetical protein
VLISTCRADCLRARCNRWITHCQPPHPAVQESSGSSSSSGRRPPAAPTAAPAAAACRPRTAPRSAGPRPPVLIGANQVRHARPVALSCTSCSCGTASAERVLDALERAWRTFAGVAATCSMQLRP